MQRCTEAGSFLWLSARISRCLKYFIYAFAAVNYRYIIHFLMKWVELWKFHIRYQPLSSFSASGNAAQIIDFLVSIARATTRLRNRFRSLMIRIYKGFNGL